MIFGAAARLPSLRSTSEAMQEPSSRNFRRVRMTVIVLATLISALTVVIGGIIGWVGLIIPHICRMLVGPDFRKLLPASMLLGATFLLVVDILARTIASIEVPLGILTAAIGAPFFLFLLAGGRRGWQ